MNQQQILESFNKHWAIACSMYNIPLESKPRVEFFNRGTTSGKASRKGNMVAYNTEIAGIVGSKFENTIVHEIAHIVAFKRNPFIQPHGKEWKSVFLNLGGNGERCHNYDLTGTTIMKNRTEAKCNCKTHLITQQRVNKIKKGVIYSCTLCKSSLSLV